MIGQPDEPALIRAIKKHELAGLLPPPLLVSPALGAMPRRKPFLAIG